METKRQQKVAKQIQKDISDIFRKEVPELFRGAIVTVTTVRVSPDLGYAKIYMSVFPYDRSGEVMTAVKENDWKIRKALGVLVRHQLKVVPELSFFLDDSLEYVENIDSLLK